MKLETVLRKVAHPPAPQNWVRLIEPNNLLKTANKIASFALGIPPFNYTVGITMCHDRVRNQLDLETALKVCAQRGAPAGRAQNADFVSAFYSFDEERNYSSARYFDSYNGFFPISRDVKIPTKPNFTIVENKKQVPVVLCGWKSIPLDLAQRRIVSSVYESGLFSYGDYRNSPAEIVFFPECITEYGKKRVAELWQRGDYNLLSTSEIRELLEFYSLAQEQAIPIICDRWSDMEKKRRDRERTDLDIGSESNILLAAQTELFD